MSGEGMIASHRLITGADSRPRVHLWQSAAAWQWSIRPTGMRNPAPSAGAALDEALSTLDGPRTSKGVVVIVEPPT